MVTQVTSLGRTGLSDWLIQRVSAIVLAVYTLFLLGFFILYSPMQFEEWRALFTYNSVRLFTLLALLCLMLHSWVGIWTVVTDYIKCAYLRLGIQTLVIIGLILMFAWGIQILWSI